MRKRRHRIPALVREQLRVGDWAVIGIVLLLAAGLTLFLLHGSFLSSGRIAVEIWQNNELVYSAPLADDTDAWIPVTSEHGQNQIRLHGLTAQIAAADCLDQVCVRTGTLTRVGQTAVCLPHRVMVKLVNGGSAVPSPNGTDNESVDTEGIDAVAS